MRVPRCALRRAAVLRLLIIACLLACGDGGGGGGGVRASECCRCRRAWRRRSRRFCCPGRLALTCCCPDGLLGMHCLLACVAACALLWPAGWLAARLRLDTRVCACDRRMRSCARHAAAQRVANAVRYDAVLVTHGARMACGWRHGAALAWRLHAHALTRAARWVDVADWRCCMATRRRRSALACGDACHHHHRCRRHHHYHDDDDDDAGGDR